MGHAASRSTLYLAAVATGAFAFVALTHCPVEPWSPPTPGSTNATSAAETGTAISAAPPAGERLFFGPASAQDPRFATWSRSGFVASKSGRKLATWTDCACQGSDESDPPDCRIAVWDLVKRRVATSFEAPCVPEGPSVQITPSEDRLHLSSLGIVSLYDLSDGHLVFQLGERECKGYSELADDGRKIFRFGYCGGLALLQTSDGAQIGGVELPGINELGDSSVTWDPSTDVVALSVDDGFVTLFPLRGGRPSRVRTPRSALGSPPRTEWIPGTSKVFLRQLDGATGLLDTASNTFRPLRGAEPTRDLQSIQNQLANGQALSGSRRAHVEVRLSRHLWVIDLPSGKARDLGVAVTESELLGGFVVRPSPDGRRVSIQLFQSPSGKPDDYGLRVIDVPPAADEAGRAGGDKGPAPVDSPVSVLPSGSRILDWLPDGSLLVLRGKALSALDAKGTSRALGELPEVPREVKLAPGGRAVIAIGRSLTWMGLEGGRTATFVLTKVDNGLTGSMEGVANDAAWAAMGGPAP